LELPSPKALPANERRRASQVVRLTLACAEQVLQTSPFPVDQLRMVFASDEGTGEVCQQMLEALATTRLVSPLLFHNSVHNAPSGYLSIGYQNRQSAASVSLGQESFASGLLCAASEACSSGQPVLFLAYDPPMTEPMCSLLPVVQATATAWIIASGSEPASGQAALASFELSLHPTATPADQALPAWLPAAWAANSSARGLVALALLGETQEHAACELRLGAQVLRIERVNGVAGMLTRSQIQSRIPHAGAMCLLDSVQRWDATTIICQAAAPTADHPLARAQGVPAVAAVEYAAQAAAVHGSLLDETDSPRDGMLAKLTEVELCAAGLDEAGGPLTIRAELLSRVASGCMYRFEVSDQRACVARGRLLVAFQE
jgi:predicted hotdog family 3-hydroxylacyl-ACP dehydratase